MKPPRLVRQCSSGARLFRCERLESRSLLTTLLVSGTPGDDLIVLGLTAPGGISVTLNGKLTEYLPAQWTDITIDTGTGVDAVTVAATNVPVKVVGHSAVNGPDDAMRVGSDTGGVRDVKAAVAISNATGAWNLTLDDAHDPSSQSGTLGSGSLSSFNSSGIAWDATQTRSVRLDLSSQGGNTLDVTGTKVPTTIFGHGASAAPADHLLLSKNGITAALVGPITIANSGGGQEQIDVDDSADTIPHVVNFNAPPQSFGTIGGLTPAMVSFSTAAAAGVTLRTPSSGGNAVNIQLAMVPLTVVAHSPQTGSDAILHFDGGPAGTGTVAVRGSSSSDGFTIGNGTIVRGSGAATDTIHFPPVRGLTFSLGQFLVPADLGAVTLTADGAGTQVTLGAAQHLLSLAAMNSATVAMISGSGVLDVQSLTVAAGATLDLTNNRLVLHYASDPINDIRAALASGYANGAWNGPGIDTGSADASHGLGFADDGAGTLVVAFVRYGDANLDNTVDFNDLLPLAQHFNQPAARWDQGDFNYDGVVDFNDLLSLAQNFAAPAGALVPQMSALR